MSIASEITRLQGVKSDILDAIADKGVTVPAGSDLAACPALIAAISGGGSITLSLANIMPTTGVKVVDDNGYIGGDFFNPYYPGTNYYNNFAIKASGADFSSAGLGQVTFVDTSATIGGRVYPTVTIGGATWITQNLDYKFSGVNFTTAGSGTANDNPDAVYYNNNEALYSLDGTRKCGALYNWFAVNLLIQNAPQLIPGWHVATKTEWEDLFTAMGGTSVAGNRLKALDNSVTSDWPSGWNGTEDIGFNLLPSGYYWQYDGAWQGNQYRAWTGTESGSRAYYKEVRQDGSIYQGDAAKRDLCSIRLVKDSA